MGDNVYHFVTRWRVRGTVEEVADVLAEVEDLPRWWPSVYLAAEELEEGDEEGIGKVVALYTKGWLPYTLRWRFRVTESDFPHSFALEARGDFVGRGVWSLQQEGAWVEVVYDWRVRAEKPLLRRFSFLLRPIFEANHRWAMARGEESLRLELARRAGEAAGRPPGPTGAGPFLAAAGVLAAAVVAWWWAASKQAASKQAASKQASGRARQKPAALKPPVPDGALAGWRRVIGEAIGSEVGKAAGDGGAVAEPGEEALLAFRSRYGLEREVRALWERVFGEPAPRRGMTLLLEPLAAEGALRPEMAEAIEVVSRVASPAVHAQGISEAQVRFLQEVAPLLAGAVRSLRTKL